MSDFEDLKSRINIELVHHKNRSELVTETLGFLRAGIESVQEKNPEDVKKHIRQGRVLLEKLIECDTANLEASRQLVHEFKKMGSSKPDENQIRELFDMTRTMGYRVWGLELPLH